jgi:hypothetical protein
MNRVQRTVRSLAAPAFLFLACAGAWASDDEQKVMENPPEANGESFVSVGTERQDGLTPTPTTPYVRKGTAPLRVVAPPANIEEIRQQTAVFLERLKANPEFQNRVGAMLRRVREREGASQPPNGPWPRTMTPGDSTGAP